MKRFIALVDEFDDELVREHPDGKYCLFDEAEAKLAEVRNELAKVRNESSIALNMLGRQGAELVDKLTERGLEIVRQKKLL